MWLCGFFYLSLHEIQTNHSNVCSINEYQRNSTTSATLSNGLYLDWSSHAKDNTENGITDQKVVYFDIDGPNEGRGIDQKDKHYFLLYRKKDGGKYGDIRIRPIAENGPQGGEPNGVPDKNSTWITFKVFDVDDNGNMKIRLLDQNYENSYDCYDDKNNICNHNCKHNKCFIEPIPPLK